MGKRDIKKRLAFLRPFLLPLIAGLLLIFCASFAGTQQSSRKCTAVVVNIKDDAQFSFIDEQDIRKSFGNFSPEGRLLSDIDIQTIESNIRKNPFVKSVQVYADLHGKVYADVVQRIPVVRIINPLRQEYYLDKEGKRMPLSKEYTAYVPFANPSSYYNIEGNRDSTIQALDSSLFILSQYLDSNKFAHALIGQIIINPYNEMTVIPRLGDFQIELGNVNDLDDKFLRLQSFYSTTLPQVGWDKYKKISLKYKNQIIANN